MGRKWNSSDAPVEVLFGEALVIHAGPCWSPLLGQRVSAGLLTRGGCGELVDRTLHPVAYTIIPHRRHLVVVGGVRFQTIHPHPEDRLRMALVEPDVIFRCLAQIIGIGPVVYDRVMVVVASRIGGGPPDDRDVVVGSFERWPFDDLDVLGLRCRWRVLSADWAGVEGAAGYDGERQRQ